MSTKLATTLHNRLVVLLTVVPMIVIGNVSWAQTEEPIEEIVVTAQRVNEDIQEVPIAVTALTDDMIEDKQVITPSDLQMNSPSVTFTATNFGGSSFAIRGVGSLGIGAGGPGVSAHTNEIAIPMNMNTIEFFDLERIEILRGPQGTLFGRNATGGAINFITNKPSTDGYNSSFDLEEASYDHTRIKGMVNVPLSDDLAVRVAALKLKRDGYTKNLAYGQVGVDGSTLPQIKQTLDGRDILAVRATMSFDINEDSSIWVMASHFEEDDDRARITNQVCDRNPLPTVGCKPDSIEQESPHIGSTTAGIFSGMIGLLPLGESGASTDLFNYPRPRITSLREIHTDYQPEYFQSEQALLFGFNRSIGSLEFNLIGARRENEYRSRQDYTMDVGAEMAPNPANPLGIYPVTAPSGSVHSDDWSLEGCSLTLGTSGAWGGCQLQGYDVSRQFSYDQSSSLSKANLVEARIHSDFDGPMNYLAGISAFKSRSGTAYYVMSNGLDTVTTYGVPALGLPPLYPGYFLNSTAPLGLTNDSLSGFGELYYDMSDRMKFTVGMRVNQDKISRRDNSTLFNALNHAGVIFGVQQQILAGVRAQAAALGIPPEAITLDAAIASAVEGGLLDADYLSNTNVFSGAFWSRTLNILLGPLGGAPESALAMHYGVTAAELEAAAGTPAYSAARVAISKRVPIVPGFNEARDITGSPSTAQFDEVSGRIGLDWQQDEDTLWYGFYSRGYKPGGLNPAIPPQFQDVSNFTFEPETVNAIELGRKDRTLGNRLTWNSSLFYYDYTGLQASVIKNNSSITENIDASIGGLETEGSYQLESIPSITLDFSYGFLYSEVGDSFAIDTTNRTAGLDEYILLKNIDPGSLTGVNYVVRESDITAEIVDAALQSAAALDVRNGIAVTSVSYPENSAGVSIPAYFSRNFLAANGIETYEGLAQNLSGNELPYAPRHNFRIGGSHTIPEFMGGSVVFRWDYFWQTKSFARYHNSEGDRIDSWGQHNVSVGYESLDDTYSFKFWMRNVMDDTNVTGHYLTSDTSGLFRNYFLTEPRIGGMSIRVNFD